MTDYTETLIEDLIGRFDFLLEVLLDMRQTMVTKTELQQAKIELASDVQVVRSAVTDLSKQVTLHIADQHAHLRV